MPGKRSVVCYNLQMQDLAIKFRCLQFVTHACHQKVKGVLFPEYHELFGELYGEYETSYDKTVERMIGTGMEADPSSLTKAAAEKAEEGEIYDSDPASMVAYLNDCEKELRDLCSELNKGAELGNQDLFQKFAGESLDRSYKFGQIVKNGSNSSSPKAYSAPILRMVKPSRIIGA